MQRPSGVSSSDAPGSAGASSREGIGKPRLVDRLVDELTQPAAIVRVAAARTATRAGATIGGVKSSSPSRSSDRRVVDDGSVRRASSPSRADTGGCAGVAGVCAARLLRINSRRRSIVDIRASPLATRLSDAIERRWVERDITIGCHGVIRGARTDQVEELNSQALRERAGFADGADAGGTAGVAFTFGDELARRAEQIFLHPEQRRAEADAAGIAVVDEDLRIDARDERRFRGHGAALAPQQSWGCRCRRTSRCPDESQHISRSCATLRIA